MSKLAAFRQESLSLEWLFKIQIVQYSRAIGRKLNTRASGCEFIGLL
jgi:hypothetical protein